MKKAAAKVDVSLLEWLTSLMPDTLAVTNSEFQKAQVALLRCFDRYITRTHGKYSKIKTLLYRDKPVDLKAHYVSADFQIGDELLGGDEILAALMKSKRNIITGTAGSGKSVLLRKIALDLIEDPQGVVPGLLELRLLNGSKKTSILTHLFATITNQEEGFTEQQLHHALKLGRIVLLLDGFDEIDYDSRDAYEVELLDIANKYPLTTIVVSSRPDECFQSWEEFYIYRAEPLSQGQAAELVSKIDYDDTVKEKFIAEINNGLYEKHSDFLSNPLLLTMMLLTYEQLAEIPEKIHIFYEQAFDTLYHRHDALKSLYKRKSYSNLPIDDFKKIFAAFCIITFSERKMTFSYEEMIHYIEQAIDIEEARAKPVNIFNDLLKSVCIIQKDGNIYTFSHRSFQEYFSAVFLSKTQSLKISKVLDEIARNLFSDNVIKILRELNGERLETEWVQPKLKSIIKACEPHYRNGDAVKFLFVFYDAVVTSRDSLGFRLSHRKTNGFIVGWFHELYKEEARIYWPANGDEVEREESYKRVYESLKHLIEPDGIDVIPILKIPRDSDAFIELQDDAKRLYLFLKAVQDKLSIKYSDRTKKLNKLLVKKIKM